MAGVPGKGGPVPKRSDQRRRRNKPDRPVATAKAAKQVRRPPVARHWHPLAKDWYRSLGESGQVVFYQPSDWQRARYIAEAMTRNLESRQFSAMLFASVSAGMSSLLDTEGDRRRLKIELERAGQDNDQPEVPKLDDYRGRLSG